MITNIQFDNLKAMQKVQVCDTDGSVARAMKEDEDTVFVFRKGSRKYGRRLSKQSFCNIYTFKNTDDENTKWHKRIKRAIKCLESSGVNPWLLEILKGLNQMTYEEVKELSRLWSSRESSKWSDLDYNKAYFAEWFNKYPFLNDNGFLNTEYIGGVSEVKLKSMSFGYSSYSAITKEEIRAAISNKSDYRTGRCVGPSYDHSFSYSAKNNRAVYQEEYHSCGNGHYYYALDHKTAIFGEDD